MSYNSGELVSPRGWHPYSQHSTVTSSLSSLENVSASFPGNLCNSTLCNSARLFLTKSVCAQPRNNSKHGNKPLYHFCQLLLPPLEISVLAFPLCSYLLICWSLPLPAVVSSWLLPAVIQCKRVISLLLSFAYYHLLMQGIPRDQMDWRAGVATVGTCWEGMFYWWLWQNQ